MADDDTLRSYRSHDPYRHAGEPSRPREATSPGDPLAELARLIGQSDPFAEFGRGGPRRPQADRYSDEETYASPGGYGAPAHDDWHLDRARDQRGLDFPRHPDHPRGPSRDDYAGDYPLAHDPHPRADHGYTDPPHYGADPRYSDPPHYDDAHGDADYPAAHDRHAPRDDQEETGDRMHTRPGAHAADHFQLDDARLAPDEDAMYDDAPRRRRHGGLATALALIGCAMLGTAGAYAYRSYYGHPGIAQAPPVITADNKTPTKIVPAAAGDQQPGKVGQDRVATAGKEQIISKQEEPVALREFGTQAAPRVVLPAPVAPAQAPPPAAAPAAPAAAAPAPASPSTEPRKIKTVTIRPDGTDLSGRPVGAPSTPRSVAPPAPRAAAAPPRAGNSSGSGPISLDPQSPASEPAAPPRTRTAAAPAETTNSTGGFVVQLSSQRTENEALASFRSLQAKFPNELGGRKPVIRRADLGNKGVYYRANVGPFESAQEANRFCASYKAAGGQCLVPSN